MRIRILGALICAGMVLGTAGQAGAASGKAAIPAAGSAAGEGAVVVTSTAFIIGAREVEALVSGENAKHQLFTKPMAKVRRELLEALIDEKLAGLDAEKRKVALEPDFQARVESSLDSWMANRYISGVINPAAEPTDEDLAPYKPKRFERILVRQIAVQTEEEAARLRAQVLAGADFAALATEHSIAPATPAKGGELGWLTRGSSPLYPKGLLEQLFDLEVGQVSAVLVTPLGYEFFRVEERADLTTSEIEQFLAEPRVLVRRQKTERLVREACERQGMRVDDAGVDALAAGTGKDATVLGTVGGWEMTAGFQRAYLESLREDRRLPTRNRAEFLRVTEMLLKLRCLRLEQEKLGFLEDPANRATIGRFRKKTLAEYSVERLLAPVVPTEEDHRRYYREHRAEIPPVQRVRLKMILVHEKERAESVYSALKAGKGWDELAGAYSVEANAARGGDLGWLFVHQLTPDHKKFALELKPGEFTAPFNFDGRWVILQLVEREGPRAPTEEEARGLLAKSVFEKKQDDFLKDYSARLRKEYKVKIDEAALARIAPLRSSSAPFPVEPPEELPPGHPPGRQQ